MYPSSPIGILAPTLRQWLTTRRPNSRDMAGPGMAAVQSTGSPAIIHYEGWHGTPSRCHVIHRRHGNRVLFAFGIMEDGGTSPTNMIEELTAAMWKRCYPKDSFDRIEWFDAWPGHYSLTGRFHIQRVEFSRSNLGSGPVWFPIGADVPKDFVEEVRQVINVRVDRSMALAIAEGADLG